MTMRSTTALTVLTGLFFTAQPALAEPAARLRRDVPTPVARSAKVDAGKVKITVATAADAKGADAKASKSKAPEGKPREAKPRQDKAREGNVAEVKTPDTRLLDGKTPDPAPGLPARVAAERPAEAKDSAEPKSSTETRGSAETKGAEAAGPAPAKVPVTADAWLAQTREARFPDKMPAPSKVSPAIIKLQVMLDRAHASPGVVDGHHGSNVTKAVSAYQTMRKLPADGVISQALWDSLEKETTEPPLMSYAITVEDLAGPFVPDMPKDYAEMATLYRLGYRGPQELLAEKFHMDEDLLRRLNPDATFQAPGETIIVADVRQKKPKVKVARMVADKATKQLLGYNEAGDLVVAYPATIGSKDLPSPTGTHLVGAIAVNPEYWYRPSVNFQQGDNTKALRLAPGPNNPVGSVWIGLDKPTYGIHGTPEPSKIDKTNSHGCIRLANWDVEELVKLVAPGVPVEFLDGTEVTGSIR